MALSTGMCARQVSRAIIAAGLLLTSSIPAWPVEITPLTPVGPAVQYWAWDLKAFANSLDSPGEAQLAYGVVPANLVRFPIFAQSISQNGSVDASAYTTQLRALAEIRAVNPNVKIFASLKLLGANTFPSWVNSTDNSGKIFGDTVYRPDPVQYANLLTSYAQFMAGQGYTIDFLGPGNETGQALGPTRFAQTVDNLRTNLAARGLALPTIVGPDAFSLTSDGSFDHSDDFLMNAASRSNIDIVGSHFYVKSESATNWRNLSTLSGGKPMWHTEVHIDTDTGGDLQQIYRDSLATAFRSNLNGVSGFVHWAPGTDTTNITAAIKRELITTMLGSTPTSMSTSYAITDPNGTPLYQSYYNAVDGNLYLWVANPGAWLPNTPVQINDLAFNGAIGGTWWQGDSETITATNTGSQSVIVAPDGRAFTSTFKSNAVTVLTIPVAALSSTYTWDADLGSFNAQDGSGVWNAGNSNWWRGAQSTWNDGAAVLFGAAGGSTPLTVTLGSNVAVGNVTFAGQNYTVAGDAAKQYALTLTGTPTITTNADTTLSVPLTGSGFTKAGAGTLTVGGANTYTGTSTVASGTLRITNSAALGAGGFDGVTLTNVRNGATIEIGPNLVINEHMHIAGAGIGGSGVLRALGNGSSLNQAIAFDADSTIYVPTGASLTVYQLYTDVGVTAGMVKIGGGQLVLAAPNVYSGDTIIAAGTIKLARSGATVPVVNSGFELPAFGPGGWSYLANDGVAGGWSFNSGIGSNGSPWVITAPEGVQAGFLQQSGAFAGQEVTVSDAGTYTISFQVANRPGYNANGIVLQVDGTDVARWAYTDFNTGASFISKSASVTLNAGTHSINFAAWNGAGGDVATAIDDIRVTSTGNGSLPATTSLSIASGAVFDLNGQSQTVASLNDYAGGGGKITNSYPSGATLTVNPIAGTTAQFSGVIENGVGTTGFAKLGPGTQVLAGANSYTGDTTVSGGVLLVNGSLDAGSAVSVGVNAKLGGRGVIGGPVAINGIFAPGASIESLATGTLTFNSGSTFQYDLNTSLLDGDLTVVNGDLNLYGSVVLELVDAAAGSIPADGKLTMINYAGDWNGETFDGYADDSIFTLGLNSWLINYDDTSGGLNFSAEQTHGGFVTLNVVANATAAPEPSTAVFWGLGVVGLLGHLVYQRRR